MLERLLDSAIFVYKELGAWASLTYLREIIAPQTPDLFGSILLPTLALEIPFADDVIAPKVWCRWSCAC